MSQPYLDEIEVDGESYLVRDSNTAKRLESEISRSQEAEENLQNSKQDVLVNRVNIKSINGYSLLGKGNITISGGGGGSVDEAIANQVNKNTSDIEKLMKKNFPLVVSVSGSPSGLQEYGNKYNFTVTWSAKIDGVSQPIEGVAIKINNGTWQTISKNAPNHVLEDVQTDTTVTVKLTVNGVDGTDSASLNFAHAAYMGVVSKDFVINESNIKNLIKQSLSTSRSRNYTTSSALNLQRIVYAYAQTYGAISKVLDGNGFDVTDSFEQKTTSINGVPYYVYISKEATTTDAIVTVKFS